MRANIVNLPWLVGSARPYSVHDVLTGAHVLICAQDAVAARNVCRDVLGLYEPRHASPRV
jgi:hypothetical protein